MNKTGIFRLPPRLPTIGTQLFGIGDIAYRGIEPDIQHFSFGTLHRHRDTPIQIAAHGTGLQPHIQPTLALAVDVALPLLMSIKDPLFQERLMFVQR